MITKCEFDPQRDIQEVNEIPQFECDIERMLMTGSIGEQAAGQNFNQLDLDEIGGRPADIFEAADALKGIKPTEIKTE